MTREEAQLLADLIAEDRKGSSTFRTSVDSRSGNVSTSTGTFPQQEIRNFKSPADSRTIYTFQRYPLIRKGGGLSLYQIRARVFERDRGICKRCGINTVHLDLAIRYVREQCRTYFWNPIDHTVYWSDQFQVFIRAIGRRARLWPDRLWEADHIVPKRSGGRYELQNLRTLCIECHDFVTWNILH